MVSREEIDAVAQNARLELDDGEAETLQDDLDDILSAFDSLDDIDTEGVEPSFHPVQLDDDAREDAEKDCLQPLEALANTHNKEGGYIKGPRAV